MLLHALHAFAVFLVHVVLLLLVLVIDFTSIMFMVAEVLVDDWWLVTFPSQKVQSVSILLLVCDPTSRSIFGCLNLKLSWIPHPKSMEDVLPGFANTT